MTPNLSRSFSYLHITQVMHITRVICFKFGLHKNDSGYINPTPDIVKYIFPHFISANDS